MMLRGFRTFKEFLQSDEGIATNILADRLRNLEAHGIIRAKQDPSDRRKIIYFLTPKGKDLAPVSPKWFCGPRRTKKRKTGRLSNGFGRTRRNSGGSPQAFCG